MVRGRPLYYCWLAFLLGLIVIGGVAYAQQLEKGLISTHMRDPVSWGFYIGNFTFLVGVAAAAVVLVIPAYIYGWKPIKEIVIIGELLAISAIVMCMLFVTVDIGRPDRILHLFPVTGSPNMPRSLLSWDVLVLNLYLVLNVVIAGHVLYRSYNNREYSKRFAWPLILLSIPSAIAIHTVTAFLYSALAARPYWNAAILAPRFLTSAFCSGPAIILVLLQLLRRFAGLNIKDEALWKIAELMAYAMFVNLFLFGAEIFRDYYSDTHHLIHYEYLLTGVGGHSAIVPYAWASLVMGIVAFMLFLVPGTRKNPITLNIGALLIYLSAYIEKGVALVIPGFTPSMDGEIYEYTPSWTEVMVAAGVFSVGFLVFTLMLKVAIPIMMGTLRGSVPGAGGRVLTATSDSGEYEGIEA
ncbi:MAG: polysulfide reductase NrfD [Planctomycetes bacterium]|nr:polysulfide reductase NrfD [Planctomycetota bacterium]